MMYSYYMVNILKRNTDFVRGSIMNTFYATVVKIQPKLFINVEMAGCTPNLFPSVLLFTVASLLV